MTDDKSKQNGNGEPPKISLNGKANGNGNGNGNGKGNGKEAKKATGPVPPTSEAPPKIKIPVGKPSAPKAATSRIDLGEAKPSETAAIRVGIPSEAKSQTSKIDLSEATRPETGAGTAPVDVTRPVDLEDDTPKAGQTAPGMGLDEGKERTAPVEQTGGVDATTPVEETGAINMEVRDGPATPLPTPASDMAAEGTMPIETDEEADKTTDVGDDQLHASIDESYKAAHQSTMRIELDEQEGTQASSITSEVEQGQAAEDATGTTARIDLSEVLSGDGDDVFKRRTGPVDASQEEGLKPSKGKAPTTSTPKTIRIKKADAPAPTRILQRPPQSPASPETVAETPAQPEKSSTARIETPDSSQASGPPTQRKTIRIKRPDGAGPSAKPLTVARTEGAPKSKRQRRPASAPAGQAVGAPGLAFTIVAGAAALVAAVVVYVLAAQLNSIGLGKDTQPSLPYAGRIL